MIYRVIGFCFWFSLFAGTAFAQVTTYSYDAMGRVISVASDLEDDRTYTYDKAGNIITMDVINNGVSGNVPPVCDDGSIAISEFEDTAVVTVVSLYCTDLNMADTLTVISVDSPTNGTIINFSGGNLYLNNIPSGMTAVTYTVSDGNGGSDPAILTVFRAFGGGGFPY